MNEKNSEEDTTPEDPNEEKVRMDVSALPWQNGTQTSAAEAPMYPYATFIPSVFEERLFLDPIKQSDPTETKKVVASQQYAAVEATSSQTLPPSETKTGPFHTSSIPQDDAINNHPSIVASLPEETQLDFDQVNGQLPSKRGSHATLTVPATPKTQRLFGSMQPMLLQPLAEQTPSQRTDRPSPASVEGFLNFPCKARGIDSKHNQMNAYIQVPPNCPHGSLLVCSHLLCASSGRRFRWCSVCKVPAAKRNFMKRHSHGLITSHRFTINDYLENEMKKDESLIIRGNGDDHGQAKRPGKRKRSPSPQE